MTAPNTTDIMASFRAVMDEALAAHARKSSAELSGVITSAVKAAIDAHMTKLSNRLDEAQIAGENHGRKLDTLTALVNERNKPKTPRAPTAAPTAATDTAAHKEAIENGNITLTTVTTKAVPNSRVWFKGEWANNPAFKTRYTLKPETMALIEKDGAVVKCKTPKSRDGKIADMVYGYIKDKEAELYKQFTAEHSAYKVAANAAPPAQAVVEPNSPATGHN